MTFRVGVFGMTSRVMGLGMLVATVVHAQAVAPFPPPAPSMPVPVPRYVPVLPAVLVSVTLDGGRRLCHGTVQEEVCSAEPGGSSYRLVAERVRLHERGRSTVA